MQQINFLGTQTLYLKEVRRFLKVYNQTLITPVVTSLLFLAVFNLSLGQTIHTIGDLPFIEFVAPGLVMMAVMQHAFANTSSSMVMGKVLGNIIDYLMPPLSAGEVVFAMVMGGVTRGLMVGVLAFAAIFVFVPIHIHSIWYALYFLIAASMLLAALGMFSGIIAETFDQMAAVNSYIIVPMSFLSGTVYSVSRLPEFWYNVSQYNPFFYMIDGFRYGMTGHNEGNITIGIFVMLIANIVVWTTIQIMFARGYRIKS